MPGSNKCYVSRENTELPVVWILRNNVTVWKTNFKYILAGYFLSKRFITLSSSNAVINGMSRTNCSSD